MTRIYKTPFAATGDKEPLAPTEQPDGKVSLPQGWTSDYARSKTDPAYRPVGRLEMNGILYEVTDALSELQQYGFAIWQSITGGWPENARVVKDGVVYLSTVAANTTTPGESGSLWDVDHVVETGGTGTQIQYRVDGETFGGVPGTSVTGNSISLSPTGTDSGIQISPISSSNGGAQVVISPAGSSNASEAGQVIISPTGSGSGSGRVDISPENDLFLKGQRWPAQIGGFDQTLTSDGTGKLSWKYYGGSGASPGGDSGDFQFNDGGVFGGSSALKLSGSNLILSPEEGDITISVESGQGVFINDLKYPSSDGAPSQVLGTDGSGNLAFVEGGQDPGGSSGQFQYNDNGDFEGTSALTISNNDLIVNPSGSLSMKDTIWPNSDGDEGQVLTTNGSGTLSWRDETPSTGPGGSGSQIQYRINDDSFGGVPGTSITGNSITMSPSSSVTLNPSSTLSLKTSNWPSGRGINGQVLTTNGSGTLSWSTPSNAGKVLNVYQAVKTNTWSTTSTTGQAIDGLSVNLTPQSTSSRFLIIVQLNYAASAGPYQGFTLYRGSTPIYRGDAAGVRPSVSTAGYGYQAIMLTAVITYVDSPSTSSNILYTVRAQTTSATVYINRAGSDDSDANTRYRGASSIIAMEIGS